MKLAAASIAVLAVACQSKPAEDKPAPGPGTAGSGSGTAVTPVAAATRDALSRAELNRWAVRANVPLYWAEDTDADGNLDDDEAVSLLFYPKVEGDLDALYGRVVEASKAPAPPDTDPDAARRRAVGKDLDAGRPTLVRTDTKKLPPGGEKLLARMLEVARLIDEIYAIQTGAAVLAESVAKDPESQSLFRRNRGPQCAGAVTQKDPACSAIPGNPRPIVDAYPSVVDGVIQTDPTFCKSLEARPDAETLLSPFTVVREAGRRDNKVTLYEAVAYPNAYPLQMAAIAKELTAAADEIAAADPGEQALVAYLRAAAHAFMTNDWPPADEAWAKMNVDNSKWYVRVGPDETYWDPCAHKAGFHLTFAAINQGSKTWQGKLAPVQQEMEAAIAARAGKPYAARTVTFHLPDFIDIILNAGDDRDPISATIGQSLPNWGAVAEEGRGRTVAMVNLFTDADSLATTRANAASLLDAASLARYADSPEPGLLGIILHEATHNLGPSHDYKANGKTAREAFGGPLASVMEELKAQTGTWYLLELLRTKGIVSDELAAQTYADAVVWSLGQVSQGMYEPDGGRKTYPELAAIQLGFLMDRGALTWDPKATAANGADTGAFTIHADKLVAASDAMMTVVAGIKARGDKKGAEALVKKYVDGKVVPHAAIVERWNRAPRASFVYAVTP
jgi:hypothetical protein